MDHKSTPPVTMVDGPKTDRLAVRQHKGAGPGLIWLGGYASDMLGTKATALYDHAAGRGFACTLFDYSGHGESDGAFEDGTIGIWARDALHILDHHTEGPQVLVGSSMGGWIAGLLARWRPERIAGLVLVAPAPDFTDALMPLRMSAEDLSRIKQDGKLVVPSEYDDSEMVYTAALFSDGDHHLIFDQPLDVDVPVRILSGMADDVVPWRHVMRYADHLSSTDVVVSLVKAGDHRMSGPEELKRLFAFVDELTA
ncbi:alpha/beta hydrolase [Parvularcula sp. LCG005]|uniref:alpha/beta hydrolase n=1 Tax=Parvularcula sp. LCG005 TaxID=3078805 RepID=UPI002941F642|nr:alpha/beta hydrolase [Parvularcula sp. LCG005]WOI53657.1 alpha/beta hydrolase [Parvularcula sp. LCG005]